MAKFFIDRPIFAWVIAIILMLAGIASVFTLPIAQYPTIAPPAVQISATYPGASAKTVENTVTQVIEQQMSGLDHLLYLSSTSDDSGTATITLTFAAGTNPDIAQVQVQNKLQLATPLLPQAVQQLGTKVTKSSSSFLLVMAFVSEDGSMNKYDLANYVASNVQDPVSRIDGVGTVTLFGSQYAMRIWLDANKLTNFGLTPVDVQTALQAQNVQVAGGSLGGTPSVPGQVLQATITEATLLQHAGTVRQHSAEGESGRLASAHARTWRVSSSAAKTTTSTRKYNGAADRRLRYSARHRRQRAGHGQGGAREDRRTVEVLPARPRREVPVRHDAVRAPVDRRSGQDAARRYRAGVPGHVPVPAEPARHADPDDRRAGGAAGHVRDHGCWWASRSTRCPCSGSCSRSACWWTMRSWWWKTSSG